jgi:hypothetical protein
MTLSSSTACYKDCFSFYVVSSSGNDMNDIFMVIVITVKAVIRWIVHFVSEDHTASIISVGGSLFH